MRHFFLLFTLLCTVILTGCGEPHKFPGDLHLDPSFTDEEVELIKSAVEEWEFATDGIVRVNVVRDGKMSHEHSIHRVTPEHKLIKMAQKRLGVEVIGWSEMTNHVNMRDIGGIYIVWTAFYHDDVFDAIEFRKTILHELGHHWGISHLNDSDSLMAAGGDGPDCITNADLSAFCSLYTCGNGVQSSCAE